MQADPAARRLLARWAAAQERLTSYFAQVQVDLRRDGDDAANGGRPGRGDGDMRMLYTVRLQKWGQSARARLTQDTTGVPDRWRRALLVVADGKQITVEDRARGGGARVRPQNGELALGPQIERAAGFNDWARVLDWLTYNSGLPPNRPTGPCTAAGPHCPTRARRSRWSNWCGPQAKRRPTTSRSKPRRRPRSRLL
jgi:hypothetical protein